MQSASPGYLLMKVREAAEKLGISKSEEKYVLDGLNRIGEHHEPTALHSIRVGLKEIDILRYLQKNKGQYGEYDPVLGFLGMLHDIGKTKIPLSVIEAKDFGEKEMEVMRTHTTEGYEILMADSKPYCACLALTHHLWERPPYPGVLPPTYHELNGKRDYLRKHARILSLADHNDAIKRKNAKRFRHGVTLDNTEGRREYMLDMENDKRDLVDKLYKENILN